MQVNDDDEAWLGASHEMRAHVLSVHNAAVPPATNQNQSPSVVSEKVPPAACPAPSIVSALYWAHKDAYALSAHDAKQDRAKKWWFSTTEWAAELAPRPVTNALNPIPAKPLKLAYAHPTDADWVGVPRFWGMSTLGAPREDRRSSGCALSSDAVTLARPLRDIQQQALAAILKSAQACGGAFVQADCGTCFAPHSLAEIRDASHHISTFSRISIRK